jgi:Nif-specific regulatory protein
METSLPVPATTPSRVVGNSDGFSSRAVSSPTRPAFHPPVSPRKFLSPGLASAASSGASFGTSSPAMGEVYSLIARLAPTDVTVALIGETGTGKDVFAHIVHDLSPRSRQPFVVFDCGAVPPNLVESELFGHERGAFTGAHAEHAGAFERAAKGTLFLDEIGEISASFQAKLLRVLQEQEFERVGGNQTIKVDVRVIAATNRNLEEAVARNEFRADLYYRISVVPMILPPLRERRSDIPLLANEFLKNFNTENDRTLSFDRHAIEVLMSCGFPGNVRELENCVQRTATLAPGPQIVRNDFACCHSQCLSAMLWNGGSEVVPQRSLPIVPLSVLPATTPREAAGGGFPSAVEPAVPGSSAANALLAGSVTDRDSVIAAMEKSGWVQAKAARLLGLTPRQIGYALKKYGIEVKRL